MSWEEVIANIVGDAINGVIVGVFTVIGVGLTLRHNKRKEERQEKKEKYNNRPELTVDYYKNESEKNFDMQLLVARFEVENKTDFKYSKLYENKDEYVHKDFIFKNVGKTAIESLDIVSAYKRNTSIFNMANADRYMELEAINYGCLWDKKIFPDGEIKVRLYFHKDIIVGSGFSCAFIIQFRDSNGICWEQPFFENNCNLYSPREISYKEYNNNISVEKTMECFEKPYLW